jgi:hypothetical protein
VSEGEEATAHAVITGRIVESEVRTNTATHRPFVWALIATLGGSYDAVFSTTDAPEALRSGQIVQGTFWLVGRVGVGETLRVERRRGLRGLFDR